MSDVVGTPTYKNEYRYLEAAAFALKGCFSVRAVSTAFLAESHLECARLTWSFAALTNCTACSHSSLAALSAASNSARCFGSFIGCPRSKDVGRTGILLP